MEMGEEIERVSMDEIEAEEAVSLPNKEVMSLLDVNANVDLGLDLAAPVDLAVAANLNVAAPIEAAASANLLSPDAQAVGIAQQSGSIDQGISGEANAVAPQHAEISQDANSDDRVDVPAAEGAAAPLAAGEAQSAAAPLAADATAPVADGTAPDVPGTVGDTVGDVGGAVPGTVGEVGDTVGDTAGGVTGGVNNLLAGGSLLDANIDIHANADVAAPINGAVAANANVAAPIDAAVAANIGSEGAVAQSLAQQEVNVSQHLDNVEANATAEQDASVDQQ
jgi:hypothetical protein